MRGYIRREKIIMGVHRIIMDSGAKTLEETLKRLQEYRYDRSGISSEYPGYADLRGHPLGAGPENNEQDVEDDKIFVIMSLIGLGHSEIPFDNAPAKNEIREIVRQWSKNLSIDQIVEIVESQARLPPDARLETIDRSLVDAINKFDGMGAGTRAMRGMMHSLYKLQAKIILFKCREMQSRGIDPRHVDQLVRALEHKFNALDAIMDAKHRNERRAGQETGQPRAGQQATGKTGGGAVYKAKKYKYKYLRAKNAI